MTQPTVVAAQVSSYTGNSAGARSTTGWNIAAGDRFIIPGGTEDSSKALNLPVCSAAGVLTFAPLMAAQAVGGTCWGRGWMGVATGPATNATISATPASSCRAGIEVVQVRGDGGMGNSVAANAGASLTTPLTVQKDSLLIWAMYDWNGGAAGRTGTPNPTELIDGQEPSVYSFWAGYSNGVPAGVNTPVGVTTGTSTQWTIVAIEVLGIASKAIAVPSPRARRALMRSR
jgi:hypothetical protein